MANILIVFKHYFRHINFLDSQFLTCYYICRTIDKKNFSPVVHISAIDAKESKHVHLVAVTESGKKHDFLPCSLKK